MRENLLGFDSLDKEVAKQMQPLTLASVGDAVHTLFVREYVLRTLGVKINAMNKLVSGVVNAGAQFRTMKKLEDSLTEEEQNIASRARNSHLHSKSKNYSIHEYIYATAYEALVGYLYLSGQQERLNEILTASLDELTKIAKN